MDKDSAVSSFADSKTVLSAGLLRSLAVGLLVMSIAFVLFTLLVTRELVVRGAVFGGAALLISIFVIWMVHHNRLRLAGSVFIAFLWLMVSAGSYTAGGVNAPIFVGYMAVVLICALVLGNASGVLIALVSVAFGGFLVYAEANQFLPPPLEYSSLARLSISAFFLFILLLFQKAAVDTMRNAMFRAHASEARYRAFLENIPTVTYINDTSPDALTTYVSPQVTKILGYERDAFVKNPGLWLELIAPEDRERVLAENARTSETGEPFIIEYRLLSKEQLVVWVRDEAILIRDEDGRPAYWLGIWTDITERKNAEKAQAEIVRDLTNRTNQLQTASEVSRAASSMLDPNELLPRVVDLIRSHFNYYYVGIFLLDEKGEVAVLRAATGDMGRQMLEMHHSLPVGNSSMIGWCISNNHARIALDVGKDAVRFKNPLLPLTRSELALPLRTSAGIIGAMTIQSEHASAFTNADVTALQTMADQVAIAIGTARLFGERSSLIDELESKNAELERFSYTVSHDLKSPLVTIRGFLGYLREDARKGDLTHFDQDLGRVINATETMENLLNDLLELSRIGRIINPPADVPFDEIVEDALDMIIGPAKPAGIKIVVQESLPTVHCDRVRVLEVMQNLVSNAAKFMGDQSDPLVEIGLAGQDPGIRHHIFFIKDNGIGIEPEYHEKVFGLFNRLNPEMNGTGIGLALVRRIIEVHGGRIWLESEGKNKGSVFYFTLPFSEQDDGRK